MNKTRGWLDRTLVQNPMAVALCTSEKEFVKKLSQIKLPKKDHPTFLLPDAAATVHFFEVNDNKYAIVCLSTEGRPLNQLHGLLVHEAVHIWQVVKEIISDTPSHEFEAYAIQSISQTLMGAL